MRSSITYPQPDHPEFSVIKYAGCHEYRLENSRPHMVTLSLKPLLLISCMAVSIQILPPIISYSFIVICLVFMIRDTFLKVLYESVVLLPPHGVQLETHLGFSRKRPLISNRRFIPSTSLEGVIINEGLSGWNVLYYLALVKRTRFSGSAMDVAYQHLLPPHSILLQTFEGIHEFVLFSPSKITESKKKANIMD